MPRFINLNKENLEKVGNPKRRGRIASRSLSVQKPVRTAQNETNDYESGPSYQTIDMDPIKHEMSEFGPGASDERSDAYGPSAKATEEEMNEFESSISYDGSHVNGPSAQLIKDERSDAYGPSAKATEEEMNEFESSISYDGSHVNGPSAQLIKDEKDYVKPSAFIERSDAPGPSTKPLRMEREKINHIFYGKTNVDGSKKPFRETKIGDGPQDVAGDTTIITGHATKHKSTNSLLSRFSVRGVLNQLFRQSSLHEARRRNSKSLLSAFGLGESLLEEGKTSIRWRCVCGRNMYDDFTELQPGAAAKLEKWLNHSIKNHTVARASSPSQNNTLRSSTSSSAGVSGQRQTAGSDMSLQPLSWTASTMPDSSKNAAITIDVHLEKCWLLICGQSRRGPDSLLAQLDLSSKPSDKDLFDSMKEFHSSLRSTWTLQPVLRGVQTIRFVQASFETPIAVRSS